MSVLMKEQERGHLFLITALKVEHLFIAARYRETFILMQIHVGMHG